MYPVGGHAVGRSDGPQGHTAFVGPLVAHHADALHGQQHGARLPHLVVKIPAAQRVDIDFVHLLQHGHLFGCHFAQDTDSQPRSGERMAAQDQRVDAERTSHAPHLVLAEQSQRLDNFKIHMLGQSSDVVGRLDRGRRTIDRTGLDHVGIDRPLPQPPYPFDADGLLVEDLHEIAADDLAFALRIGHAPQIAQETVTGLDALDVEPHTFIGFQHAPELVLAQQTRIDENTVEVPADRPVEQHRRHRGIHAARKPQNDPFVADAPAQLLHGRFHETLGRPALRAAADADHKIAEQLSAVGRVVNLRMELNAPRALALHPEGGHGNVGRTGDQSIGGRHRSNRVAVRHPDLRGHGNTGQQRIGRIADRQHRTSVFAARSGLHLAPVSLGKILCAVADAEQRQPPLESAQIGTRSAQITHREGASREDYAPHRIV